MNQTVFIKSNRYGIDLILDDKISFDDLLEEIDSKFRESAKFFKNAKLAITFSGRELTDSEEKQIIDRIQDCSDIEIICILEEGSTRELMVKEALDDYLYKNANEIPINSEEHISVENANELANIYRGTLRNGQSIESDASIVIVGDVNPGASVSATGNIIILGTLKGNAYAGKDGDDSCFVYALNMSAMQIRIGNAIGRSSDNQQSGLLKGRRRLKKKEEQSGPSIATAVDGMILLDNIKSLN